MKVGVLITSRNDPRLSRALESLEGQSMPPTAVVVADGSDAEWVGEREDKGVHGARENLRGATLEHGARWVHSVGATVPEARNMGIQALTGVDVVSFLDTDEYAPKTWLERLTGPISEGTADFAGGPTRWLGDDTRYQGYLETIETRHYERVSQDISVLPMGNSAWKRDIFTTIGGFDESLRWAGEDYDINLRALGHGFRGTFVAEAWVFHDQSDLNTARRILRRKFRYMVGGAMAYKKNRALARQVSKLVRQPKYWHWLEFFNPPLRFLAYTKARMLSQ